MELAFLGRVGELLQGTELVHILGNRQFLAGVMADVEIGLYLQRRMAGGIAAVLIDGGKVAVHQEGPFRVGGDPGGRPDVDR